MGRLSTFPKVRFLQGFTLVEILVVMTIIVVLSLISFSAITGALTRAHSSVCSSNLHRIGIATQLYANDNSGQLPFYGNTAADPVPQALMYAYISSGSNSSDPLGYQTSSVWKCPGDSQAADRASYYQWNSYGVNYLLAAKRVQQIKSTSSTMWMADCSGGGETTVIFNSSFLDSTDDRARHNRVLNVLYIDGHVEGLLALPDSADTFWTGQ